MVWHKVLTLSSFFSVQSAHNLLFTLYKRNEGWLESRHVRPSNTACVSLRLSQVPKNGKHVLPPKPVLELEKTNVKHLLHAICFRVIRTHSIEWASTNHFAEASEKPINLLSPSYSNLLLKPVANPDIHPHSLCGGKRPSCSGLIRRPWHRMPHTSQGENRLIRVQQ